jgi:uncharacterized membrane protein HdeD (DUF308 family)
MVTEPKEHHDINELNSVAATKIEDGESLEATVDYLIRYKSAEKNVAEQIAKTQYESRQKLFRIRGIVLLCIGLIIIISSFVLNEMLNYIMAEWHRSNIHRTGGLFQFLRIILWIVSFFFLFKGLMYLLFGGKGIKTKRVP